MRSGNEEEGWGMKGRQKLCRRLGTGSSLTVKYLRAVCVYCAKSAINGEGRNSHSYLSKACNPGKKMREEDRRRNVSSRCVEQMARVLFHLLFLANFRQFSNLSLSLFTFRVFLTSRQERKNGRKAEGTNATRAFQALINFSPRLRLNSCVLFFCFSIET